MQHGENMLLNINVSDSLSFFFESQPNTKNVVHTYVPLTKRVAVTED